VTKGTAQIFGILAPRIAAAANWLGLDGGDVSLFVSAEGTAMSDRSYSGAATGGARVSF